MASETYPLALPEELKSEIRAVATELGLSVADTMRLALKVGVLQIRPNGHSRHKNSVEWAGSKLSLNEHLQRLSDLGLRFDEHPSARVPVPACRF